MNSGREQFNEYLEKPLLLDGETNSGEGVRVTVPLENSTLGGLNYVARAKNGNLTVVPYDWLSIDANEVVRESSTVFRIYNRGDSRYFSVGDKLMVHYGNNTTLYYYIVGTNEGGGRITVVRTKTSVSDIEIPNEKILSFSYTKDLGPTGFNGLMSYVPTVVGQSPVTVNSLLGSSNNFSIIGDSCFLSFNFTVSLSVAGLGTNVNMTLPVKTNISNNSFFWAFIIPNGASARPHAFGQIGGFTDKVTLTSGLDGGLSSETTQFTGQLTFPIKRDQ